MHRNEHRAAHDAKRGIFNRPSRTALVQVLSSDAAANESAAVLAGSATEEEQALARMFGGDRDDGLVIDARERGTRAGSTA